MNVALQVSSVLSSQLQKFAAAEKVSVEEFLLLAAAEKIAAIEHHTWLTDHKPDGDPVDPCGDE